MNRIDRLHAILTHLQSKKRVTAKELADRFKISLRTIYRDVKALEESGVPILGEAGSGYSVMEGYRLPPVMFTQEEASALLVAGKLAEHLTDISLKKQFETAMFKIKAVLRGDDRQHIDSLNEHIAVYQNRSSEEGSQTRFLVTIQKAIVEKKVVELLYQAPYKDENSSRKVEPIGLCYYGANWHMIAWCQLRSDYRDFRLSRIQQLSVTAASFANKTHRSLQQYMDRMVCDSELQEVVVVFKKEAARYIGEQKYYFGFLREEKKGNGIRMYFLTSHLEGLSRWLLMFKENVIIEKPAALSLLMQQHVEDLITHYEISDPMSIMQK